VSSISFSAQNCNSLNLTGLNTNLELKIAAITSTKTDFIFLSDVRVVNAQGVRNDERVTKAFMDAKDRSYLSILNSTKNARGVGILIANDLDYELLNTVRNVDENFLTIKIKLKGKKFILTAVYGPNNADLNFFNNLDDTINQLSEQGTVPIIMGGDWNTTWDSSQVVNNIDTFQMAGVPNPANCNHLKNLCARHDMTDPYRVLYPYRRDFSYSPFGTVRLNRSRIDFFVVSLSMVEYIRECAMSSTTLCRLFDHKNISLLIGPPVEQILRSSLSNRFLENPIFKMAINSSGK